MKAVTYSVVCFFRDKSYTAQMLSRARGILTRNDVIFSVPSMGDHMTILPPFDADENEIKLLAAGLEMCNLFSSDINPKNTVVHDGFSFFRNEGSDALVLRLKISRDAIETVERWRAKLSETHHWKFPPESFLVNAHATVGEGKDLYEAVETLPKRENLSRLLGTTFGDPLPVPVVVRKDTTIKKWVPVRY